MSSGFEGMRSKCSDFLHPHNDVPTDKTSGVFAFVPRKRRVNVASAPAGAAPGCKSSLPFLSDAGRDEWLQHRGKKVSPTTQQHDPTVLSQVAAMQRDETFKGSLQSTRFGGGFFRKTASAIGSDAERIAAQAQKANDTEVRVDMKRHQHADRSRNLSPISWEETTTSKHYNSSYGLFSTNVEEKTRCKKVFPDRFPTTVGPPATPNTVRRELEEKRAALQNQENNLTRRQQRVRSEGLAKPREWSVSKQMSCGDGFILTEMQPVGEPVRRKMLNPGGPTRPW